MTTIKEEITFRDNFIKQAIATIGQHPSAVQVVLFETNKEDVIPFVIYDLNDEEKETQFFEKLKSNNNQQIIHVLAMWKNHCVEVPKFSILLKILELDFNNINTCCVLLNGENGINGFQLNKIIPDKYKRLE